jgi:hypothetical protein
MTVAPREGRGPGKGEDGMNAKRACLVALVMTLAGVGAARAQYRTDRSGMPEAAAPAPLPAPGAQPGPADAPMPPPTGPRLSDYILGSCGDCCGPIGADGPVTIEPYTRWGLSLPINGGVFGHTLETGWIVQGGARTLFFDADRTGAWTADLSISNIHNQGQHSDISVPLSILVPDPVIMGQADRVNLPVTISNLNRTFANLAVGREWYLWGPAPTCATCGKFGDGMNLRAGFDLGGRWGSAKLDLHEIKHRTEVIEGLFVSLHADLEIPWEGLVFVVGGRVEWDQTWMHQLLQDAPEVLQEINLLATFGVRY